MKQDIHIFVNTKHKSRANVSKGAPQQVYKKNLKSNDLKQFAM